MKTALVTGAAGFLGYHLCEKLLDQGYNVVGLDNFLTGQKSNIEKLQNSFPENFLFIGKDIVADWQNWQNSVSPPWLKSMKFIFHFASVASPSLFEKYSVEIMQANSIGLQNAINFADIFNAKVIFASTSEIYGSSNEALFSELNWGYVNSFGVRSCYDESKRFGEAIIFAHNQRNNSRHGLVRIFNTYGPRMNPLDHRVIQNFLSQAIAELPIKIYGDGRQRRSFCYVDDLIEGILQYANRDLSVPLNLGRDEEISVNELIGIIGKILNTKVAVQHKEKRLDDPVRRRPDLTRSLKLLAPWQSKVSLEEGLRRTYKFLALKA